ncbi:MAG: hypothetical protein PUF83_05330 [Intestinibaculum porci]|jgi:cell division protein FtsL|uniref:Cell division protein FtsL n=1 Tax=Intestinibaculum porci TaxID=2487118 RepID=A0A3G9JX26_9FIRM|nr:hypothetical protein [Intestinibaculum porci]MDD6422474.1 hypothetical protein [Intestinibaculum porci]BBH27519.1 hypothetical protein SG0102_24530 [Intestinibaculum porci]
MIKKLKKQPRFFRYAIIFFMVSCCVFLVSLTFTNSCELNINAKTRKVQNEITTIQSDIDGLEIQKSELASFSRLKKVATSKGYHYKQGSTAAAAVSDEQKN